MYPASSSLPLYVTLHYSTHNFLLQTTEQIKERLDRMLNTPDTSLIITGYPSAPAAFDAVWVMAFAFPNAVAKYVWREKGLCPGLKLIYFLDMNLTLALSAHKIFAILHTKFSTNCNNFFISSV